MVRFGRGAACYGIFAAVLNIPITLSAAQVAYDSAGDSAYNDGFTQGTNGGFGWGGGWAITQPVLAVMGDSADRGLSPPPTGGAVNSPPVFGGRAWGLNGTTQATRPFLGDLAIGQTFSVDYDNGLMGPVNPQDYMSLNAAGGGPAITFGYESGRLTYLLQNASGSVDTGVPITYGGLHLTFTRLASTYDVTITSYAPGSSTEAFELPVTDPIDSATFAIAGGGLNNSAITLFFNNIQIVPEPSLLALACLAVLPVRRCRRTSC